MRQRGQSQSSSSAGYTSSLSSRFESSTPAPLALFLEDYLSRAKRYGKTMRFKLVQVLVAATFTCLGFWLGVSWFGSDYKTHSNHKDLPVQDGSKSSKPGDSLDERPYYNIPSTSRLLGHNGIVNMTSPSIELAKLHITVSEDPTYTIPLMQKLNLKLPRLTDFDPHGDPLETAPSPIPIATMSLTIPQIATASFDASHILIGVATTYERLEESLDQMGHWASNTNVRIIGSMQPSLDLDAPDRVLAKAKALNVPLGTVESGLEFLDRYFNLLILLHENRNENTKWYGFIDDDTFFLSLRNIVTALSKYPDPTNTPHYVGSLTEDFRQMAQWGFIAYGGAGIFISAALIEQLIPHYEACASALDTGDRKLAQCIYKHTTTKLTWEHGLHQLDLRGDQSGFYEALRSQPLSIHHWKSEEFQSTIDVYNMTRVSRICGEECVLQKYRFKDGWVLTNGFSLVKYSDHDTKYRSVETDVSMETTWTFIGGTNEAHFEHTLAPFRKSDPKKISYRMESALVEENGRVRQLYVKRSSEGIVDAVVEIAWLRAW